MKGYNGWKNYETWNVALWMHGDETLYQLSRRGKTYAEFLENLDRHRAYAEVASRKNGGDFRRYAAFLAKIPFDKTPDGVEWTDKTLDRESIDEMIADDQR